MYNAKVIAIDFTFFSNKVNSFIHLQLSAIDSHNYA